METLLNIASNLTTYILIFVAVLALIGAFKGMRRGICRQLIRTGTIILSVVIAVWAVRLSCNAIMVWLDGQSTEQIIEMIEGYGISLGDEQTKDIIYYVETGTINYILAIPLALIIAPIAFLPVFLILTLILYIAHAIVSGIFFSKRKHKNPLSKLLGAGVGALQGVLVAVMISVPIVGLLVTSSDVVALMNNEAPDDEATVSITETYDEYLAPFAENPMVKAMGGMGAKLVYNTLATVSIDDVKYKMVDTLSVPAVKIYASYTSLDGCDYASLTEDDKAAMTSIVRALDDSEYVLRLSADVLSALADAYEHGAIDLGEMDDTMKSLIGSAILMFKDATPATVSENLHVLLDSYFILSDDGVLKLLTEENVDMDELLRVLSKKDENGQTPLDHLVMTLNSNENTALLVTSLTKATLNMAASQFKIEAPDGTEIEIDVEEVYVNVKDGINQIVHIEKEEMTEEEYVEEISTTIDKTLKDNGIELDDEMLDVMAEHAAEYLEKNPEIAELEEITETEFNEIFLSYYDGYLEYLNSQK